VGKSDDSIAQSATQIFIVVFGGRVPFRVDVQRTEGIKPLTISSLPRLD
jgi:hypothetical protein